MSWSKPCSKPSSRNWCGEPVSEHGKLSIRIEGAKWSTAPYLVRVSDWMCVDSILVLVSEVVPEDGTIGQGVFRRISEEYEMMKRR